MFSRRPGERFNRGRIAVGGGWSPMQDPAVRVWLDADSGVTDVSGAASAWANQADTSLIASVTQSTASRRPTIVSGGLDGRTILRGTNAADTGMSGAFASALSQVNTIFVVGVRTTVDATTQYFCESTNGASRHAVLSAATTGALASYAGVTALWGSDTSAWGIWVVTFNSTSSKAWRGSTLLATADAGTQSMDGLTVFNYLTPATARGLDGDIATVIVCDADRSPGTAGGNQILGYLQLKYPSAV